MFQDCVDTQNIPPVTYSLRGCGSNSDNYYGDVALAADELLAARTRTIEPMLERFMEWIADEGREPLRSDLEYTFDALTIGVLWRLYGGRAQHISLPLASVFCALYRLRRRFPSVKRWVDPVRGVLSSRFLTKREVPDAGVGIPGIIALHKLQLWMDATGEYREEVKRFHIVLDYLDQLDEAERDWYMEKLLQLTDAFLSQSSTRLGMYTKGVETWLRESAPAHRNAEDVLLCSRKRPEYHLNMVGAELMNRAFAGKYDASAARAVLLPACMRGAHAKHCQAKKADLDLVCTGCSANCRVNSVRKMAAKTGATTHIIPHSSDFTRWLGTWAKGRDIGVIGVACVLHLITGGLELRSVDIPAQCVLLDHCGCTQHWDPNGRQTELNEMLLEKVILNRES